MLVKTDELQDYLTDASFIRDGHADRVVLPETVGEVAEVLAQANRDRVAVTVSGAGTGTVGGRVPYGGMVLATEGRVEMRLYQPTRLGQSLTSSTSLSRIGR